MATVAAPDQAVARRQSDHLVDRLLSVLDVASDVSAGHIDIDPCRRHRPFSAHDHRSSDLPDVRDLSKGDLRRSK